MISVELHDPVPIYIPKLRHKLEWYEMLPLWESSDEADDNVPGNRQGKEHDINITNELLRFVKNMQN